MPLDITPAPGLSAEHRRAFEEDGFFRLERAFDPDHARQMEDEWWAELADKWGVVRADRSTWRQPVGDMKRPKKAQSERLFETERVRTAIDGVLGEAAWDWPKHWGRAVVTMPSGKPASAWDVPERLWHWDGHLARNIERPRAVFVFALVGELRPGGGGTLLLAGSHRLVRRRSLLLTPAQQALGPTWLRDHLGRLSPWLRALTGQGPGPEDRIGAFMRDGDDAEGIALRVVELTGAPGDVFVCDPLTVHCVAPNCQDRPRMMRIRMIRDRAIQSSPRPEDEP
ncbi:MAG: hypothetical protein ACREEW_00135 [Caulobacteraceae bacterium]